jgi:hypothetical protein
MAPWPTADRPVSIVRPRSVSNAAVSTTAVVPVTAPNVSASVVWLASASAGEAPGMNFRTPKPAMTSPRLIRRAVTL